MTSEDIKARKAAQNRASYARRMARRAEEAKAQGIRLTGNPAKAALIRLPSGKALPAKEASWLK
jgi:hypothetical protein